MSRTRYAVKIGNAAYYPTASGTILCRKLTKQNNANHN